MSSEEPALMVSADCKLPPLDGVSLRSVGLEPLPTVSVPAPLMPAIEALGPVTVTAPLFTLEEEVPTLTVAPLEKVHFAPTLAAPPAPLGPGLETWRMVTPLVVADALAVPPIPVTAEELGALEAPPVALADALAVPTKEVELAVAEAVALPPLPEEKL